MRPEAEEELAERLAGARRVLDVGGAREISRYATHVVDVLPRDVARRTWGRYFVERPIPAEQWIERDICDVTPFPFPDKFFDYAVCSQILEDIRDPVRVCQEVCRVAKAGYVETPSPFVELTRGIDPGGRAWVGYYHHRWLVEREGAGLVFLFKPHFLIASRRFHFPRRYAGRWDREGRAYTRLAWEGHLPARESVIVTRDGMETEIEGVIRSVRGEILPMRYARIRRAAWNTGVRCVDRLGMRVRLRPLVERIRRWT